MSKWSSALCSHWGPRSEPVSSLGQKPAPPGCLKGGRPVRGVVTVGGKDMERDLKARLSAALGPGHLCKPQSNYKSISAVGIQSTLLD